MRSELLVSDDFHERAFSAAAIELAIEDLFPRAEIEFAFGNGDDDFAAHDLPLQMGVGVVFAGAIVPVGGRKKMGSDLNSESFREQAFDI